MTALDDVKGAYLVGGLGLAADLCAEDARLYRLRGLITQRIMLEAERDALRNLEDTLNRDLSKVKADIIAEFRRCGL